MADKIARRGIAIYIDGSQVANSVNAIRKDYLKLIRDQKKMVIGSEEYILQTRKIAQLKGVLDDHKSYQAEVAKEYSKMSDAADEFEKKSKKAFNLDSVTAGISRLKGAIVGFIASFTVDKAIKEFSKLDDAYVNVQKYTGLTRDEIKELNKDFASLDTRTARIRLNELAGDAGRLGLQGRKDILDFVEAANIIDVALGEDLGEGAIKSIGKLAEMFGDADKMGLKEAMLATGSAINEVAQNSSAAEPYLVDFTNRLSGVGNQAGFSISQIIGLGSVLDQNSQQLETSATALGGLVMKMYQEPAKFAKIAGLDVKEFSDLIKKDANEALLTLLDTLGQKGGLDKLAPIFKEMNLNGARSSSILSVLAGNIEQVRKEQKLATDAFKEGTSVLDEYDVQNNSFSAKMEKQKKVLLEYVTSIGEKLAPLVLEGASAVNMLLKGLAAVFSILIDHRKSVLAVVTAYLAYNTALKINTLWQARSNVISKAMIAGNAILKGSLYALQVAYFTLTRQTAKARGAMVAFGMVTKLTNPLGMLTAAITAVGAGLAVLFFKAKNVMTSQKAIAKATKELNDELGREISQSNRLFEALKRTNPESDEHRKIKNKIIEQYGPYLKGLIDEEGNLRDIAKAHAAVNTKLREQISLKIKNAATDKIQESSIKRQIEDVDDLMEIVEKQMKGSEEYNKEAVNAIRENINRAITEAATEGKTSVEEFKGAIKGVLDKEDFEFDMFKRFGFLDSDYLHKSITRLTSGLAKGAKEVKKVEDQFKGIISEGAELKSLIKEDIDPETNTDTNTGGGGDNGRGDKVAVQRKKVQDALRVLEEKHLKDMSEIKARYLNGDIKDSEAYNKELLKQQEKADADKKAKLQELLKSTGDSSLRIDIAKQIADIDAKALERQVSNMEKARENIKKENKKAATDALKQVDIEQKKAEQLLAEKRAQNKISEEEYRDELLKNEQKYLEERLKINNLTEDEIAKLKSQQELNEGKQKINKADARTAALDKYGLANIKDQKEAELALIKYYEEQGILHHDEAIKAREIADQKYLDELTDKVADVNDKIQSIGANLTGAMSNFASAEENAVARKYDKQIAAAEGNAKKQKKLEEQKQKEQNEIKAKYADKQFAVAVATTISSTAVAAMEAYKAMAGIPVVGPTLGALAAGAAVAYGASQIAVAKEQRDAAKAGYFDGGFTGGVDPKKVRGLLPDGSPVHGSEFVANRHLTANPQILPALNLFDEAQKHGTAGSLTKKDLQKALNIPAGGYMQGGFTGYHPTIQKEAPDKLYVESYDRFVDVMKRLEERLDVPFTGIVSYKGDDGIEEAQELDKKLKKNATR